MQNLSCIPKLVFGLKALVTHPKDLNRDLSSPSLLYLHQSVEGEATSAPSCGPTLDNNTYPPQSCSVAAGVGDGRL